MTGIIKNKKIEWNVYSVLCVILAAVFLVQLAVCIYLNLYELGNHIGYDSSWPILKSALVWREKSLSSPVWMDQTGTYYDSGILLASLLYGITRNILFSYGMANVIILLCIIAAAYAVMNTLKIKAAGILVGFNFIVCPYLTNGFDLIDDLGYFSSVISGPAFYAGRVLTMLVFLLVLFNAGKKRNIALSVIAAVLCILSGMSVGIFLIVVLIAPLLLYLAEKAMIENNVKTLYSKEALYIYGAAVCTIVGKMIGGKMFPIQTIDEIRTWTAIDHIFINIGAVVQGFFKLCATLPVNDALQINIMSKEGVVYLFTLLIMLIIVVTIVTAIKRVCTYIGYKEPDYPLMILLNIALGNIVIFSLFNVQYGSYLFEERYLVVAFMAVILIAAYAIDKMNSRQLYTRILLAAAVVGFIGTNIDSDIKYMDTTTDVWQTQEICKSISEIDGELVYVWGDTVTITLGRDLRVLDMDKVYKCIKTEGVYDHWGDYLYYERNEDYSGQTILLTQKSPENYIPEDILSKYTLYKEFEHFNVYTCQENPIDMYKE